MSPPTLAELCGRREEIFATAQARGASRLRVFGSVARGEGTEGSDVDFLVDLRPAVQMKTIDPAIGRLARVESSGGGEFSFGLAVSLLRVVKIRMGLPRSG